MLFFLTLSALLCNYMHVFLFESIPSRGKLLFNIFYLLFITMEQVVAASFDQIPSVKQFKMKCIHSLFLVALKESESFDWLKTFPVCYGV